MICENIQTSTQSFVCESCVLSRTKKRGNSVHHPKTYICDSNITSPNIYIYWYSDTLKYIVQAKNKKAYMCFLWKGSQNKPKTMHRVRGNILLF